MTQTSGRTAARGRGRGPALAAALVSYISLMNGENFDPSYDVVLQPFARTYQVVKSANTVLEGAPRVPLGRGMTAGVTALARLFKAMALGMAIQQYERIPIDISVAAPVPQPRAAVLDTVLSLLEAARTDLAAVADTTEFAEFRTRVLGGGINLKNTID